MPIYDYKCNDCDRTYDIFHKVREVVEDIICPSCGSKNHIRLLSAPSIAMSTQHDSAPVSGGGCCCGGACEA